MNYRGFTINIDYHYTNGKTYGSYYLTSDPEKMSSMIVNQTLDQVKDDIDDYLYECTEYRVRRKIAKAGETITKFYSLVEAFLFAEKVNGEVEMYVDGERVDFDAI